MILKRFIHLDSATKLSDRVIPKYVPFQRLYTLQWPTPPQNVYITKKPRDKNVFNAFIKFIKFLNKSYPHINIMLNNQVINELKQHEFNTNDSELHSLKIFNGDLESLKQKTDLLVSLGGDGTILHSVSQFSNYTVPPILSFSMGTLGFLLPFDFNQYETVFKSVINNESKVLNRSRLECQFKRSNGAVNNLTYAMNEVTLHRGSEENMISLDIFVDNELLTTTTADGILVSTPTGSTAYSLSSGGPIVHPMIKSMLITPICPRSLSFRPLLLPSTSDIMIRLSPRNRNIQIKLSIDGLRQDDFKTGDEIYISKNLDLDNNIWCITRGENDWTKDINELLGFNKSFKQRLID